MLARSRLSYLSATLARSFSEQVANTGKVLYNKKNPYVMEVILNNEKALNSLDQDMIDSLTENTSKWNKDSELRLVVFKGAGKKAFCAGGDVKSLYEAKVASKDSKTHPEVLDAFFRKEFTCDYKIASMKPLQVAIWDGIVMGGGVGISIHAPFRIATENSVFAMPEAKIGFFTDVAGGYFLSRLKDNVGLYLGLTSQRLKGADLVKAGVANYYVPSERLSELEEKFYSNPKPESLTKSGIDSTIKSVAEKIDGDIAEINNIKRLFGSRNLDEVMESLQKEAAENPWAQETLKLLQGNSPLSMRVIWEQLRRAKTQDLKEALKSDFRTCQRFMEETEFFEGVRCLLVDRKDKPKWQFNSSSDIKDERVNTYFEPFEKKDRELAI